MRRTGVPKAEASAQTRSALLEAGAELLREEPVGAVMSQITGRAVARRAGRTAGAFFHHWTSQEAYQRDLLGYILDPARMPSTAEAVAATLAGVRSGADPAEVLRQIAEANFAGVRADPYVPLWFALWARHGQDPAVRDLLFANYETVLGQVLELVQALLDVSGRHVREPFTARTFAVLLTALVQGLSLRVAIDPHNVPVGGHPPDPEADPSDDAPQQSWDLFGSTAVALFNELTVPGPEAGPTRGDGLGDVAGAG